MELIEAPTLRPCRIKSAMLARRGFRGLEGAFCLRDIATLSSINCIQNALGHPRGSRSDYVRRFRCDLFCSPLSTIRPPPGIGDGPRRGPSLCSSNEGWWAASGLCDVLAATAPPLRRGHRPGPGSARPARPFPAAKSVASSRGKRRSVASGTSITFAATGSIRTRRRNERDFAVAPVILALPCLALPCLTLPCLAVPCRAVKASGGAVFVDRRLLPFLR